MIFASAGWAVCWGSVIWARLSEGWSPSPELAYWISTPLALVGFAMAVFTIRSRRSWLIFVSVPLFANGVEFSAQAGHDRVFRRFTVQGAVDALSNELRFRGPTAFCHGGLDVIVHLGRNLHVQADRLAAV